MNSNTQHIYLSCDVPSNTSSTYQSAGISYKTDFSGGKGVLKKKRADKPFHHEKYDKCPLPTKSALQIQSDNPLNVKIHLLI